jgi:hypothetical protein
MAAARSVVGAAGGTEGGSVLLAGTRVGSSSDLLPFFLTLFSFSFWEAVAVAVDCWSQRDSAAEIAK